MTGWVKLTRPPMAGSWRFVGKSANGLLCWRSPSGKLYGKDADGNWYKRKVTS